MKIAVFGLGYVGMVNIACFSKLGNKLYGCDVKPHKADLLKNGKSTILEPGIDELLANGHESGMIEGTTDADYCVSNTELALICVGTPSDASGKVNLNYILNTAVDIVTSLVRSGKKYTMVFRSTIPPGTIEEAVLPVIKQHLGSKAGQVSIVFLPEFLREGSAVNDFFQSARIVIGLNEKQEGREVMEELYAFSKEAPLVFTDYKTAEFVKYVDNAYHATKVAFANEIYSIGSRFGVNVKQANEIFLMDNILNISGRYLRPGNPFGGSCLPKDTRAIIQLAEQTGVEIPFFQGLVESNKKHQKRLMNSVLALKAEKVLILGLTFKHNTDDIRESPFLVLLRDLVSEGKQVRVFDTKLNILSLRLDFPDVVKYVVNDRNEAIAWADAIVINEKDMATATRDCGSHKLLLNCTDNNSYGKNVKNLY